jgi:hypothetical protein
MRAALVTLGLAAFVLGTAEFVIVGVLISSRAVCAFRSRPRVIL